MAIHPIQLLAGFTFCQSSVIVSNKAADVIGSLLMRLGAYAKLQHLKFELGSLKFVPLM